MPNKDTSASVNTGLGTPLLADSGNEENDQHILTVPASSTTTISAALTTAVNDRLAFEKPRMQGFAIGLVASGATIYSATPTILNYEFSETLFGGKSLWQLLLGILFAVTGFLAYGALSAMTLKGLYEQRRDRQDKEAIKVLVNQASCKRWVKEGVINTIALTGASTAFYINQLIMSQYVTPWGAMPLTAVTYAVAQRVLVTYSSGLASSIEAEYLHRQHEQGSRSTRTQRVMVANYFNSCARKIATMDEGQLNDLMSTLQSQQGDIDILTKLFSIPYSENNTSIASYSVRTIGRLGGFLAASFNHPLGYDAGSEALRILFGVEDTMATQVFGHICGVSAALGWGSLMSGAAGNDLEMLWGMLRNYIKSLFSPETNPQVFSFKKVAGVVISFSGALLAMLSRIEVVVNIIDVRRAVEIFLMVLNVVVPSFVYALALRRATYALQEIIAGPTNDTRAKLTRLYTELAQLTSEFNDDVLGICYAKLPEPTSEILSEEGVIQVEAENTDSLKESVAAVGASASALRTQGFYAAAEQQETGSVEADGYRLCCC